LTQPFIAPKKIQYNIYLAVTSVNIRGVAVS
jgi:hypothetical protein